MNDELKALITANRAFYRAFSARDATAMAALWARDAPIACIHPGWDALTDRSAVLASWQQLLANPVSPRIRCQDERPFLYGPAGVVICHEVLADGVLVATNVFVREDGIWKIVHHQAAPVALRAPEAGKPESRQLH